jgi:alkanesulfonate monooxygenase SsuD/methylene tetrahydromethanopterin reductase-like flavin-dependent oxidoreductase (luciferase family)
MTTLKIDTVGQGVSSAQTDVARAGQMTFDSLWYGEMSGEALDAVLIAATQSSSVALGCAVSGGLVRNPMECAYRLADIRQLTPAELRFGIGAQARQVVRHQYGASWARPLSRLIEFRQAIRAIWEAWACSESPKFRGEFFHHVYTPPPCIPVLSGGPPLVLLGATGGRARAIAASEFDGLVAHPCTPIRFLKEVIAPEFRANAPCSGARAPELVCMTMMICVGDEPAYRRMLDEMRLRIWYWAAAGVHQDAFAYVGLSEVTREAMAGVRRNDRDRIASIVSDEVVREFCSIGTCEDIGDILVHDLSGVVDRATVFFAPEISEDQGRGLLDRVRRT